MITQKFIVFNSRLIDESLIISRFYATFDKDPPCLLVCLISPTTIAYNNHDHKDIKIKAGLQMLVLTSYKSGHDF
jgi:uncharacterized membrane protein